jgi:hypothetical protein
MQVIAEEANPFYLRELYLDGCEKINDIAISVIIPFHHSSLEFDRKTKESHDCRNRRAQACRS